jgi:hypothetical protein
LSPQQQIDKQRNNAEIKLQQQLQNMAAPLPPADDSQRKLLLETTTD